jgi:SWI/SNF-related matrix-associated actin-dependent regulator of chromatin subfamily A3
VLGRRTVLISLD